MPAAPARVPKRGGVEPDYPPEFAEWWSAYPKREAKPDALKAWSAKRKAGARAEVLLASARHFAAYLEANPPDDPKYVPLPATFLNKGKWLDWRTGPPASMRPPTRNGYGPAPLPAEIQHRSEPTMTDEERAARRRAMPGPVRR